MALPAVSESVEGTASERVAVSLSCMAIALLARMYRGAFAETETICVPSRIESSTTVRSKNAFVCPEGITTVEGTVSSEASLDFNLMVTFEAAGIGSQTCPRNARVPSPSLADAGMSSVSAAVQDG